MEADFVVNHQHRHDPILVVGHYFHGRVSRRPMLFASQLKFETFVKPSSWMLVSERVVNGHVKEEGFEVGIEELLNYTVVEFGVDEDGADVGFHNIGKTFGDVNYACPVVDCTVGFHSGFIQLGDIFVHLRRECLEFDVNILLQGNGDAGRAYRVVLTNMLMKAQFYAYGTQELIGYHRGLVFRHPLRVFIRIVKKLRDKHMVGNKLGLCTVLPNA